MAAVPRRAGRDVGRRRDRADRAVLVVSLAPEEPGPAGGLLLVVGSIDAPEYYSSLTTNKIHCWEYCLRYSAVAMKLQSRKFPYCIVLLLRFSTGFAVS
jgi:hypothetical protein